MRTVIQYVLYLAILIVLAIPLGAYMKKVMCGEKNGPFQSPYALRERSLSGNEN